MFIRKNVALRAGRGFNGDDVAGVLSRSGAGRAALPEVISVDNGTAFTSKEPRVLSVLDRVP